jgi:hypothetical protein
MSLKKSPRSRGRNGRAARTRFVEVEMPAVATGCLVIELDGGGRILLSEPAHVTLLAQLLESVAGHRKGGRP